MGCNATWICSVDTSHTREAGMTERRIATYYHQRAEKMRKLARAAETEATKAAYLMLAKSWEAMACDADQNYLSGLRDPRRSSDEPPNAHTSRF